MMLAVLLLLGCGSERAEVKTLHDADAATVAKEPQACTVEELIELPPLLPWHINSPRTDVERKLCRIDAAITAFKVESDNDLHIVIMGASGETMIIELPHPNCAGRGHKAEFAAARRGFLAVTRRTELPAKGKVVKLAEPVPITAVCSVFFDTVHGQLGVAKNGVEGHPCKSIVRRRP